MGTKYQCSHAEKSHAPKGFDEYGGRCCACWQTKEDLDNRESLLRFCECMEFELNKAGIKE